MFVSQGRLLPVTFAAAASRLDHLIGGQQLDGVSERAYHDGMEYLLRVGPAGAVPGASRLVRVRFAEPVHRNDTMSVPMRWEATGLTGGLFPALDADILLSPDGEDQCRVTLTGSYRPPLGALGETLDRMVLHTVAEATIATLLSRIAASLEGAPAQGAEPDTPWLPGLDPSAAQGWT